MPDHNEYETGARKLQGMPDASGTNPEKDAEGQSETHHSGGANDGVSSANPRVLSGNDDGDATFPFESENTGRCSAEPGEDSDRLSGAPTDEEERRPAEAFPPFDDPAFSAKPAQSPVQPTAPTYDAPPKDTEYAGHPDFSQDAALDVHPHGIGNSEPLDDVDEKTRHSDGQNPEGATPSPDMEKLGAGSAIAEHSKDAKAPKAGRQPGAYVKE